MRNILLNIATEPRVQDPAKPFVGRRFELYRGEEVIKETPTIMEDTVQFVEVPVGSYVARVTDIGADGSALGSVSIPIEVTPSGTGDTTYPAAIGLSYTLE